MKFLLLLIWFLMEAEAYSRDILSAFLFLKFMLLIFHAKQEIIPNPSRHPPLSFCFCPDFVVMFHITTKSRILDLSSALCAG